MQHAVHCVSDMWLPPLRLHIQLTGENVTAVRTLGWTLLLHNRCDAAQGQACRRFMTNATANDMQETNKINIWFRTGSGTGLNADGGTETPTSAVPMHAHYFIFYFFIQHRGVDILESSHACYCFSTTPRLPGTSSSTSFVSSAPLSFYNLPFSSRETAKVRATPCFSVQFYQMDQFDFTQVLADSFFFVCVDWWLAKPISTVTHRSEECNPCLVISFYVVCNKATTRICDIKMHRLNI